MESKTEITPTVIIIEPSGFTDLIEVDSNIMTKQELAELIDAETSLPSTIPILFMKSQNHVD